MDNSKQAGLLGYIAGFFDGEGNIGSGMNSGKTRNSFFLKLSFSQNNHKFLEELRDDIEFDLGIETGKVQVHSSRYNKLSSKDSYSLSFQGGKAYRLACLIRPYSKLKTDYLQWIIDTWEGRWNSNGTHNREFLQQQHDNRPGRRAAATTKRKDSQK